MKKLIILTLIISFFGCQKKTDLKKLLVFDSSIRKFKKLSQLGHHNINDIYFKGHFESDTIDEKLSKTLDELRLSEEDYKALKDEMNDIGLSIYIRMEGYSIHFTGGSFARLYGFLVNHSARNLEGERLMEHDRFEVNVGKEIINNVYPVWTD